MQLIKKEDKGLSYIPNLVDYESTSDSFSWDVEKEELKYFEDGMFNAAVNVVERHAENTPDKIALIHHKDGNRSEFTFKDLDTEASRFAEYLLSKGVKQGERVFFYASRMPQVYFGFLGCLKIGAIAGTLFGAFGPDAVLDRLKDAQPKIIVTDKKLLENVEEIKGEIESLEEVILVEDWEKKLGSFPGKQRALPLDPNTVSFMMYTSGTEGYIDSVIHRHEALIQQSYTSRVVLDLKTDDIYWCTADPGWVTGVVYGILGNWSLGVSSVVVDNRFDAKEWMSILESEKVTVWYTAPTALRMIAGENENLLEGKKLSLRHICSVGEPLNPEVMEWGHKTFGLWVHDTWWQTETGSIMVANLPDNDIKPGSMGRPIPGIRIAILNDDFMEVGRNTNGRLAIKKNWPSMMVGIWKKEDRYQQFFKGDWYVTNDEMRIDEDGFVWFVGRDDEIIKTSGERVGSFEVESAIMEHPGVLEVGVIGKPDELRGQIVKACIVLKDGYTKSDELIEEIRSIVKTKMAAHAVPREIVFVAELPKTKSGKTIRKELVELVS